MDFWATPDVRSPDDRHASDVRLLCAGSWLMDSQRPDVWTYLCHRTSGAVRTFDLFSALKWLKRLLFPHPLYIGFSLPRDEVDHSL